MRRSAPAGFGSVHVRTPLATRGQRIGLLGGSFNPPHGGHLQASQTAIRRLRLDQLWWIVTPGNPLKSRRDLPSLGERMAACRTLAADNRIKITGFEQDLGTTFTAATLGFLRRRYPHVNFVWVMGADNLASFHRWQHWKKILHMMPIAVVDRPGWRHRSLAARAARAFHEAYVPEWRAKDLPLLTPPAWTVLTGRLSPLSSTTLREQRRRRGSAGSPSQQSPGTG